MAGVSAAAITKVVATGKVLVRPDGKIDTDTLPARAYLAQIRERRKLPPESYPQYSSTDNPGGRLPGRVRSMDDTDDGDDIDPDIRSRLTRREFEIEKIKHQALALKLRNAQSIGTLVLREHVDKALIGPVNTFCVRLLTDCAKTIAAQVRPMVLGGATGEEVEEYIRGQHSTLLRNLQAQMKRALRDETSE